MTETERDLLERSQQSYEAILDRMEKQYQRDTSNIKNEIAKIKAVLEYENQKEIK